MATTSQDQTSDLVVEYFPRFIIGFGVVMAVLSIPMFAIAIKQRTWVVSRSAVESKAKVREPVQVRLPDGNLITAINGSAKRLRPGQKIKVAVNPNNPADARTRRHGVPPLAGAIMWLVMGLFLVAGGIVLVAVLTALDIT